MTISTNLLLSVFVSFALSSSLAPTVPSTATAPSLRWLVVGTPEGDPLLTPPTSSMHVEDALVASRGTCQQDQTRLVQLTCDLTSISYLQGIIALLNKVWWL